MSEVIEVGKQRQFTLGQAQALLPTLRQLTAEAITETQAIENEAFVGLRDREDAQQDVVGVIQNWAEEILTLGAEPGGLWYVDFDNGEGYYSWRYGEKAVDYFHTYEEDYEKRILII